MNEDLAAIGKPIADALIPGWRVEWLWCSQTELDDVIPGAMAICTSTPTRSMAVVRVLSPWPDSESLAETLWHEVTHAAWSPLTSMLPASDGATMVEEQIVERFGVLLSKLPQGLARVVAKATRACATPRAMARISALAPRARSGEKMDPNLMKKALEVIAASDAAGALELLSAIVATAAGAPADAAPPPESEPAPMGAAPAAGAPAEKDPAVARLRARMKADADELGAIRADALTTAKHGLVNTLRARFPDHVGIPAIEKKIMDAATFAAAKDIVEIADSLGVPPRARSGAKTKTGGAGGALDLAGLTARDLATVKQMAGNPKAQEQYVGRVRARIAAKDGVS